MRNLVLAVLLLLTPVSAQVCHDELREGLGETARFQQATGRSAAQMLKRVVEELEPSLPPLQRVVELPVPADDPDREVFSYLADRKLLAPTWGAGVFSKDAWQAALGYVASWYALPAPVLDDPDPTNEQLLESFSPILEQAGAILNPVAVIAFDTRDASRVSFWATLRNGVYPRLIVVKPPAASLEVGENVGAALGALSNCVVALENYVYAPADTAQRLFLATNESRMVVLAAEPPFPHLVTEVQPGQETAYLTFSSPDTLETERYTALFLGPGVGIGTILRLIPQLRTNMSVQEIIAFLNSA